MSALGIHATSIIVNQKGVLITGKSGFGKSSLALELIEQGAFLIADDVTFLTEKDGNLYASCHEKWCGCIEVRGYGIIQGVSTRTESKVDYLIELTDEKVKRMTDEISIRTYCGIDIPAFKINKDEKYLPTLVKIAGKIISKEVCLLSLESK